MTPMDAWHIVSANLSQLYKMLRTPTYKGYVDADTEAEVICFEALRRMHSQSKQEALPLRKLKQMPGEWVWVEGETITGKYSGWGYLPKHGSEDVVLITEFDGFWEGSPIFTVNLDFREYGKGWMAYLYRPMEEKK